MRGNNHLNLRYCTCTTKNIGKESNVFIPGDDSGCCQHLYTQIGEESLSRTLLTVDTIYYVLENVIQKFVNDRVKQLHVFHVFKNYDEQTGSGEGELIKNNDGVEAVYKIRDSIVTMKTRGNIYDYQHPMVISANKPYISIIIKATDIVDVSEYTLLATDDRDLEYYFTGETTDRQLYINTKYPGMNLLRKTPVDDLDEPTYEEYRLSYFAFFPLFLVDVGDSYYGLFQTQLTTEPTPPLNISMLDMEEVDNFLSKPKIQEEPIVS